MLMIEACSTYSILLLKAVTHYLDCRLVLHSATTVPQLKFTLNVAYMYISINLLEVLQNVNSVSAHKQPIQLQPD